MNSFEQFKYSESLKIIWLYDGFILLERMIGRQKSKDLANRVRDTFGIVIGKTTIFNFLDDLHLTFKRISPIPQRHNCSSTIEQRTQYAHKFMELDQDSIIFVDEAGVSLHCRYNYGRLLARTRANVNVRSMRELLNLCWYIQKTLEFYQVRENSYNTDYFIEYLYQTG